MSIEISRTAALRAASFLGLSWIEQETNAVLLDYPAFHVEWIRDNAMTYKVAVARLSGLSLRDTWIDELNSVCVTQDTLPGIGQE